MTETMTRHAWLGFCAGYTLRWTGRAVTCAPTRAGDAHGPQADAAEDRLARAWTAGALTQLMIAQERQRAAQPHPQRDVRSLTRAGKNKGVIGRVVRVEVNHFNTERTELRVLIALAATGEQRWMDADKVEVTGGFGQVREDRIAERAAHLAATCTWATLATHLGMRPGA
jgi:hypothetical protein